MQRLWGAHPNCCPRDMESYTQHDMSSQQSSAVTSRSASPAADTAAAAVAAAAAAYNPRIAYLQQRSAGQHTVPP
jgi:hypothetical protein